MMPEILWSSLWPISLLFLMSMQTMINAFAQSLLCVSRSVVSNSLGGTPRTVADELPLFMEFSRQEYWSGLPFPSPGDLPDPGMEPGFDLQADSLPSELPGKKSLLLSSTSVARNCALFFLSLIILVRIQLDTITFVNLSTFALPHSHDYLNQIWLHPLKDLNPCEWIH